MLLKTDQITNIDDIKINFDSSGLWVLNIAIGVIMFGVALGITIDDFKRLFKNPKIVFVGVLSQFILLPAATFLLILVLKPHPSFALGMMMIAACPGGNISNFYSKMAGGNAALSVSLTAFATLICIFMTPFNLHFWGSLYEPTNAILKTVELNPYDIFKLVLLILGIPLIAGMLVKHYHSKMASKIEKVLKPLSMLVFVALILIAFSQNLDIFTDYIHLVVFLVVFHNIFAFIIGFYTAKAFGLNKADTKTISMETGIQNGGLGLLLIFGFFDGLGGMALLAAFWGIWDVFSGMALSTYWGRKKKVKSKHLLKKLWYTFVIFYIKTGLFFYTKKIKIVGKENIPKKGAVLFAVNHPNGLLDPLIVTTNTSRTTHYLVRAAIFKKPIVKKFLATLNLMPIYRIRDGVQEISKNAEVFNDCYDILNKQQALMIFPEGSHDKKRTVRILSKGFTRMQVDFRVK
jgi:bile acid:Na+ symporter, BASS family